MDTPIEVYKFGGTSVGDASCIARVAELTRACRSRLVVVVSALGGVTNELVALADDAATCRPTDDRLRALRERHVETARELGLSGEASDAILDHAFAELHDLLAAGAAIRGLTARSRDRLVATGEKMSARLVAAALNRTGCAQAMDADTFLETNDTFGNASPLFGICDRAIDAALRPILDAGGMPVVTGFCGRAPCGSTTTLGRGGSDYSATLIAAALRAASVTIWTDVPGVYSADPRKVPDARVIGQLNYREAGELSYYGAKVLHPRTLQPLIDLAIPARIRSTFDAEAPGTTIDATMTPGSHPVKAVSAVPDQAIINIEGTGMAGVPGIAARIFATLAAEDVNVTMISQSSAESSVCMAVPAHSAARAEVALRRAFRLDLAHGAVQDVRTQLDAALVAVVGLGMNHAQGVASRVFSAVAHSGANVISIAQGASELNITFAVDAPDAANAVRALHETFGLHRIDPGRDNSEHFDLLLLGWGRVARALAAQTLDRTERIRERFGAAPRITLIADRSGYLFRPNGLAPEEVQAAAEAKTNGRSVAQLDGGRATDDLCDAVRDALRYRLAQPILVDATDTDTLDAYRLALEHGADVVTANKGPLAGRMDDYRVLLDAAARDRRQVRREATVGAGLPIVDTVEHMRATGDRLTRIEGCLSGTLSFVIAGLERGVAFTDVLADADRRGYIEPNPLIDVSGEDVLRKAIILSRVAGFDVADDRVSCEGIVDRSLLGLDREAFLARAAEFDAPLAERARAARESGHVLRYVARVEPDAITVGPESVDPTSPLGALAGSDNMVLLWSERYHERPLVITGAGAGIDVTAAGMMTDILRIVAERI